MTQESSAKVMSTVLPRARASPTRSYAQYLPPDYPPEGATNFSFQEFFEATCAGEESVVDFNMPTER